MVSVLIPVYQNELNLKKTFSILQEALEGSGQNWEVVFVDDGSTDKSAGIISELQSSHQNISFVKLTRNFGQISALFAGLRHCQGSCIVMISADLQDPPALISQMVGYWQAGEKFVIAERTNREEKGISQIFAQLFWRMVNRYALPGYPKGGFDFCLIDKALADLAINFQEKNTHIFPLLYYYGFKPKLIPYTRAKREAGKSQWTLNKKIKLFLDTFIGFSFLPIRIISIIGMLVSGAAFVFSCYAVASYFFVGNKYTGWTSLIVIVSLLGGLTLISLGIMAEYLWRILEQVRPRPGFVIEKFINKKN